MYIHIYIQRLVLCLSCDCTKIPNAQLLPPPSYSINRPHHSISLFIIHMFHKFIFSFLCFHFCNTFLPQQGTGTLARSTRSIPPSILLRRVEPFTRKGHSVLLMMMETTSLQWRSPWSGSSSSRRVWRSKGGMEEGTPITRRSWRRRTQGMVWYFPTR